MLKTLTALLAAATLLAFAPSASANVAASVASTPVVYAGCPGYENESRGCYYDGTIYVADSADRETLWHERGHIFARLALTDADHQWFARLVGMRGRAWTSPAPGTESPDERFADAYAACKMHKRSRPGHMEMTGYGFVIAGGATGRYRRICNAIAVLELVR